MRACIHEYWKCRHRNIDTDFCNHYKDDCFSLRSEESAKKKQAGKIYTLIYNLMKQTRIIIKLWYDTNSFKEAERNKDINIIDLIWMCLKRINSAKSLKYLSKYIFNGKRDSAYKNIFNHAEDSDKKVAKYYLIMKIVISYYNDEIKGGLKNKSGRLSFLKDLVQEELNELINFKDYLFEEIEKEQMNIYRY